MKKHTTKSEPKNVIYGLHCTCHPEEGVRYVGKTTSGANKRLRQHISNAHRAGAGSARDLPVYRWIRKHGDAIQVTALEEAAPADLNEREKHWIQELDTFKGVKGLNLSLGGDGGVGFKHSKESKLKMRENYLMGRKVAAGFSGSAHPLATFTDSEVAEIKTRLWSGERPVSIAEDLGAPYHRVQSISSGLSWPEIPWPIGPRRPPTQPRRRPKFTRVLSEGDVRDIRARIARGEKQVDIATRYGVSKGLITAIKKGRTWADVK